MSFPPAHFLVGAGSAEMLRAGVPLPRWRAWLVAGVLAVAPDLDLIFSLAMGRGGEYHGTFTHSAFAVVVVTLVAAAIAGRRWALLAGAGYASHLLVDLLDDRGRTNVLLGWPLTLSQPDAIAHVFPPVEFTHGHGVVGAALSLFQQPALGQLLHQTALAGVFALALVAWALLIRALSRLAPGRDASSLARGVEDAE